jgi:hypothetical protein
VIVSSFAFNAGIISYGMRWVGLAIDQLGFTLLSEDVWSDFTQTDTSAMSVSEKAKCFEKANFSDFTKTEIMMSQQSQGRSEQQGCPPRLLLHSGPTNTKDSLIEFKKMASNAQKLSAATEFINDAPPGEMTEVLGGISHFSLR